ncbi:exported hypothetical protein [Gammaproteobacteria bacterium]
MKPRMLVSLGAAFLSIFSTCGVAATDLPFVGTRHFNFYGGNGTGRSITIKKDGSTVIKIHGTVSTGVEYKGKFTNPIKMKEGYGYLIKGQKIYQLDKNGEVGNDCSPTSESEKCETDLDLN